MTSKLELDFEHWGGLMSDTTRENGIRFENGAHKISWNNSEIIYRITNAHLLQTSKSLLVGLNAAVSKRHEKVAPFFTGGGKATSIQAPILSISDASTHHKEIALGWYLGTEEDPNYQRNMAEFVDEFCRIQKTKPVIFGGSGGGFASIVLGELMQENSIVLSMNPQTNVLKWLPRQVKQFYSHAWNCVEIEEFEKKLISAGVIYSLSSIEHDSKSEVLILQNLFDTYQMTHHLKIREEEHSLNRLKTNFTLAGYSVFLGCWGPGHFAPWPEHVKACLECLSETQSIDDVVQYLENQFYIAPSTGVVGRNDISLSGGGRLGDFENVLQYRARSDLEFEPIPIYGFDFAKYDTSDRNLAFCLHSLRQIDFLLKDGCKNPFKLHIILHHVLDWWAYVNSEKGSHSVMAWHDMSSGLRAQKIAYLLSITESIPAFGRYQEVLIEISMSHIKWFEKPGYVHSRNHGIFQIHGYLALLKVLGQTDEQDRVIGMMNGIFNTQFSSNLIHVENSPEYHQYVISIFDFYFRTGWYGEDITQKLQTAKVLNYWLVDTTSRNLCVGDSEPKRVTISQGMIESAQSQADFTFDSGSEKYHGKIFPETGYLSLKSSKPNGNMLFSLSAFQNIGHRQADDLSFVLFDSGTWRFEDAGKYTYQSDLRKYIDRSQQHNSLIIDDQSYPVKSSFFYPSCRKISKYDAKMDTFSTLLERRINDSIVHERTLIYSPSKFFITLDRVQSENTHKFAQWFQLGMDFQTYSRDENKVELSNDGTFFEITFLSKIGESKMTSYFGDHDVPAGWISKKYQELQPNLAFEHHSTGKGCELWAVSIFDPELNVDSVIEMVSELDLSSQVK
jgi:predicted esterase YcpF (UPF0227 family)